VKKKNDQEKRKPSVDLPALKRALAERQNKEPDNNGTASEGGYSALRAERPIETFGGGRRCKCCNCFLGGSNPDNFCRPCDKAIQEWKIFPWRRIELEREMGQHCLDYVRERYAEKKKRRDASAEEVSSGSFARAIGRKTVERK